jgi:CRISPR-associated protein Csb2
LFEIRDPDDLQRFVPIPQNKTTALTEAVRDAAVARLSSASTSLAEVAERYLRGRGAQAADVERRVRIVPLPTIGHPQASPSIRRIIVEVPPDCPIDVRDVQWAFLGLPVANQAASTAVTNEAAVLVPAQADLMAEHYGFDEAFSRWRSVTPVAFPAARGSGLNASALVNALRHAGVFAEIREVRIQREPFHAKGAPAERFETPRFRGRLHHVEVVFSAGVCGPLVIGDGRFLGLGLLRPMHEPSTGVHVFAIASSRALPISRHAEVTHALRRAIMARAQALFGAKEKLPLLFHGHESDGSPARGGTHEHLFFAAFARGDGDRIDRLAVMAPAVCDRSVSSRMHWDTLAQAVSELSTLHCGAEDEMSLQRLTAEFDQDLFGAGKVWTSYTAYRPTRHPKNEGVQQSIERDVRTECARRALPAPIEIVVMSTSTGPRGGLEAHVNVKFAAAVRGPLLLGRGSHLGQGLFRRGG